ncbi:fatty acid desaturase [Microvirga lupini]|uniref:Fatty acid desaturase n=1 Tax=Microvirga lupini TaxID=420324 RepID=A0A7W4VIM8_9HYPH|nr:hypothetical protein [Microvirga lupini]MBB3017817.1 fatty acid desaturase [Microvirga lupini]
MRRLLWVLAWMAVAIWSLFAWGAYGLLDFFGGIAARNADIVTGHPETVEWLSWALTTLRGLGLGAIVVVWGLVSLLILAVPAVLSLFLGGSRHEQYGGEWRGPPVDARPSSPPFPPASGQPPIRRIERR